MKKILFSTLCCVLLWGCAEKQSVDNTKNIKGNWLGKLIIDDINSINFNFSVDSIVNDNVFLSIYNSEEKINTTGKLNRDSLFFEMPVFDAVFKTVLVGDSLIQGLMLVPSKERRVAFEAIASSSIKNRGYGAHNNDGRFNGKWHATFLDGGDFPDAIGVFNVSNDFATGTFLTETGDYRFLQGSTLSDSLFLSCFDGAHAFYFKSTLRNDTLFGEFYSGNHYKDSWWAVRDESFELKKPESITNFIGDSLALAFDFPNLDKTIYSYPNDKLKNKVTIIQILGSWCPNCKDEISYLKTLKETHNEIEMIGLCFENQKTIDGKIKQVSRLKEFFKIDYPLLIAGNANKEESSKALPFIDGVYSYPTTIIIDKKGKVRKVYTGFYGPGTGKYYEELKLEFEAFIDSLLVE